MAPLRDRVVDLLGQFVAARDRGHRPETGLLVGRVTDLPVGDLGQEPLEEVVPHRGLDDQPLGRRAGLARVAEPAGHRGRDRAVEVGARQDDQRVGSAQLQHAFLEVLSGERADRSAGSFGAGQRNALQLRAGDHRRHLLAGGEHVLIHPGGSARGVDDLGDPQRLLRAVAGVFEQDRVAQQQVRRHEPSGLIVGEVPRHDAQQRPDRSGSHQRPPGAGDVELLVGKKLWARGGVVLVDRGRQLHLRLRLGDRLAHLERRQLGQLARVLTVQVGHPRQQRRAVGQIGAAPGLVGHERACEGLLHVRVRHRGEFAHHPAGRGVDGCVLFHSEFLCGFQCFASV